ncbi:uncharacterized protein [Hyperolius riggenbachi]|uniref:uncharacterized protein n=1 Tax=Hyperolius riggenbachi TaxID=752182 RepID=UPI0035A363DB
MERPEEHQGWLICALEMTRVTHRQSTFCLLLLFLQGALSHNPHRVDIGCGEDKTVPFKTNNCSIINVDFGPPASDNLLKSTNLTIQRTYCSEDGRFCVEVSEDRRSWNLNISNALIGDAKAYTMHMGCDSTKSDAFIDAVYFTLYVKGACKPTIYKEKQSLVCEAEVENENDFNISWMDEHRTVYESVEMPKKQKHQLVRSIELTSDKKDISLCCVVSYKENGELREKQTCSESPVLLGVYNKKEDDTSPKYAAIFTAIICAVALVGVIAYFVRRHQNRPIRQRRAREPIEEGTDNEETMVQLEGTDNEETKV